MQPSAPVQPAPQVSSSPAVRMPYAVVGAAALAVPLAVLFAYELLVTLVLYRWAEESAPWWTYPLLVVPPVQLWGAIRLLRGRGRWPLALSCLPQLTVAGVLVAGSDAGPTVGFLAVPAVALPVLGLTVLPVVRGWVQRSGRGADGPPGVVVAAAVLALVGAAPAAYLTLFAVVFLVESGHMTDVSGLAGPVGFGGVVVGVTLFLRGRAWLLLVLASPASALAVNGVLGGGDASWRLVLIAVPVLAAGLALTPRARAWAGRTARFRRPEADAQPAVR